jgi:imidazolonepropionase-like amidohydrolase
MKRHLAPLFAAFFFFASTPRAQNAPNTAPAQRTTLLKARRILDVRAGHYLENAAILIQGEHIKEVGLAAELSSHAPKDAQVIDLGAATLLPGLIDCHTHLLARIPGGDDGYILNLATKSIAFRALEGAANARITLEAGYTSVRDVENEGSGYADVALRDAINEGLVPGPRMEVATRAIAAVGQYNPFGVSPDLTDFPTGAQMISGVEEARRAVREQIGHGADLIKVYADWEFPTLTVEELHVIVEEAHKLHRRVAAHATTAEGIRNALNAGVDSIEHGHGADQQDVELMKSKGVFWIPTVGGIDASLARPTAQPLSDERRERRKHFLDAIQRGIQQGLSLEIKMAAGYDAAGADRQGKNADELVALVKRGFTPLGAIRATTTTAAEALGWEDRVGALEPGKFADVIAVQGDPLADISGLQHVSFVMKAGSVVRNSATPR